MREEVTLFSRNVFSYFIFFIIIIATVYFFYGEFTKNWEIFHNYQFIIKPIYIIISFSITVSALVTDTLILHICINRNIGKKKLSFLTNATILNTSNILKYIPGRIWGCAAQILWFSKRGMPKAKILYVNFICSICAIIVSIFLGIVYVTYYSPGMGFKIEIILLVFITLDLLFILWNPTLINCFIRIVNIRFNKNIQPVYTSKFLLFGIQLLYLIQWNLIGLGGYFLAQGIGLKIAFTDFYAILASMSLSWAIGYLTVIMPGGLGIRESVMYLMLNNVTSVQTSLIIPIATRLLHLLVELSLGFIGFLLAIKYRTFSATTD